MHWIPTTDADRQAMLETIGAAGAADLFEPIPEALRMSAWDVPKGRAEWAVRHSLDALARRNESAAACFIGGGYYDHFIPAAVDALASRSEFYTAYTPYQPESSQGTLQAIYEYQSAVCRLMNLPYANASLYDGGTAVFEAATMAVRVTRKKRVVLHDSLNPRHRRIVETHAAHLGLDLATGADPAEAACVIVQNPDFLGTVRDFTALAEQCREAGALLVVSCYPISLGLLKSPGEMGADIAVAEGQSLGQPLGFGGPYLGVMAASKRCLRRMPGRIVGATQDAQGRRGYVLTLQTREQHIRRAKATSNICSNQALCALRALIYLSLLGKQGLRETAAACHAKAEYLKSRLDFAEVLNDGPTFNEFAVRLPCQADQAIGKLRRRGFLAGLPLAAMDAGGPNDLLIAVTEKRSRAELGAFAKALREASCN